MAYVGMQRSNYAAGDYYRYQAGGILGSIVKGIGGAIGGFVRGGPLGAITGGIKGVLGKAPTGTAVTLAQLPPLPPLQMPTSTTQIGPGGIVYKRTEYGAEVRGVGAGGRPRLRRMNVANAKALRRALRRVAGFGKLARRAKRDIARAASAVGVQRSTRWGGSRGVITKAEASRALRS